MNLLSNYLLVSYCKEKKLSSFFVFATFYPLEDKSESYKCGN